MLMLSVKGGAVIKPRFSYNECKLAHLLWRGAVRARQLERGGNYGPAGGASDHPDMGTGSEASAESVDRVEKEEL